MQNRTWITDFRVKRMQIGISEQEMALEAGLTEEYYRRLERENLSVPQKVRKRLKDALIHLHPEPLTLLFDYVRIRFPTMDVKHIIEDVLWLKMKYLVQEPRGMYGYTSTYRIGDVMVLTSPLEEMGVLLKLRGKGCRQFEAYLDGQKRTWYEFFRKCMKERAVFKRVDLAVNDLVGMLDIPLLISKCRKEECVSVFRSFRAFRSGGLVSRQEQDSAHMGATLYIGSMQSDLYFCLYEKAYEQLVKNGTPLNPMWETFIGKHRNTLKLTTAPEPYTLERTLNWFSHQVAPTAKMLLLIDEKCGTSHVKDILDNTELRDKHRKIIQQKMRTVNEMIQMEDNE